jgi:hypothetical protein
LTRGSIAQMGGPTAEADYWRYASTAEAPMRSVQPTWVLQR